MKQKSRHLKKLFSIALCAALVGGTALALPMVVPDSGITTNAAGTETPASSFNYFFNNNGGYTIRKFIGSETEINIPSWINDKPVTAIMDSAFNNHPEITSITIPYGVTSIGRSAFSNCTGLTSMTLPDSVTNIGSSAFSHCTGLSSIHIPDSVTDIGDSAFYECSGLKKVIIPNSVTNIGTKMFFNCTELTEITIPEGVTNIGDSAFTGCVRLSNITIPDGVTSIGEYAFTGCNGLTSFHIPDSVTSIGKYAFFGCSKLTSIILPGSVTSIEAWTFSGCDGLKSVTIPDSVTSIGEFAFNGCTRLESIHIPDSVTSMGMDSFEGCISLTSMNIPNSLEKIEHGVFFGCIGLTNVAIPDSVTYIGIGPFNGCTELTSVIIPDSVESIGDYAFEGCSKLTIYGKKGSVAETYATNKGIKFTDSSVFSNASTIRTTAVAGEPVVLNAVAIGGTGEYSYALMYKKSTSNTWTKIGKKYGTASTGSFTPKSAVKYDIMINIKDSTGKVKSKTFTVDVKAPLKNKTTVNAETVKVGEKIVLKGAASGGKSGYAYIFYYKKSKNSNWLEIKPAYTTKSAAFKPGTATSYDVKSIVMDADGRAAEKIYTVKVTK